MEALSHTVPDRLAELAPVTIMDANCALCSLRARMIDRWDRSGSIRILPIQTDRGRAALHGFGLDPDDPETWLYIDGGGTAWSGLDGMVVLGARCGGWGHVLPPLRGVPKPVRRQLYRLMARNRYRLFGRGDLCALPQPSLQARLLS